MYNIVSNFAFCFVSFFAGPRMNNVLRSAFFFDLSQEAGSDREVN